jgi:hypothetical protein
MLRAIFKSQSQGYPELELAPLLRKNENIGGGGSTASTFGTENTSFATGWPIRRPIAKSEQDWSIGFTKCITSVSSAGAVKGQNGSDLIPRDEPVLACSERHTMVLRRLPKLIRTPRRSFAVALDRESPLTMSAGTPRTFQEHSPGMQPLYLARIEDLGQSDFMKVDCAASHHVALLTPAALVKLGLSHAARMLGLDSGSQGGRYGARINDHGGENL